MAHSIIITICRYASQYSAPSMYWVNMKGKSTCHPGHDPFQQSQWHCPQSAPHHGALLSSAEVRFKQGQHFLLLMCHVPVGVSTHSVSNANQLQYQLIGFLCASPAPGRQEQVRRGGSPGVGGGGVTSKLFSCCTGPN